jgi:hypothetical protein
MAAKSVNGWTEEEVERLVRKTGRDRERVLRFCRSVDKRLFLLLDERKRRATLHFHLDTPPPGDEE